MRKKNTIIMPVSLLIVALFIGTAMSPITAVAEEQAAGAGTLVQEPPNTPLECPEAMRIITGLVMDGIRSFIASIDKEELKDMVLHALQYLPQLIETVKNIFTIAVELAAEVFETLYGIAIDVAEMLQIVWDVIDEFVLNVVIPFAFEVLGAAYNAIIKEYGTILNFLREMARPLFRIGTFLLWLAGEVIAAVAPIALYILFHTVIPGLIDGAATLYIAFCAYLTENCPNNPSGGETSEGETVEMETTTSVSEICASCAAAAAASSAAPAGVAI